MRTGKSFETVQGENRSRMRWLPPEGSLELDQSSERLTFFWKRQSRVENGRSKPAQRCSFLIPKNVTSERPIALMPTLIRLWEAMRAPEVAKWQQKYRVDWDATDGRNGGTQRTVWEVFLMEMERYKYRAGEEDLGAVAPVLNLAKALERVGFPVVWAWATHFSFPRKILWDAAWVLRAPEEGAVRRMCGRAATDHHGHPARVQVELLASAYCIAGCNELSHKNLPSVKVEGIRR